MKADWSGIECYRWQDSPLGGSPVGAHYGAFRIKRNKQAICIIAADGEETGWEHVSVTVQVAPTGRPFNNHSACLHLWKQTGNEFPLPPSILVGIKGLENVVR